MLPSFSGITSVPLQFKVPGTSRASTYSHALEAKVASIILYSLKKKKH